MRIGITSVSNVMEEWSSRDVYDLRRSIEQTGNVPEMIYVDSLDVTLGGGAVVARQSGERAYGTADGRGLIKADAVLLRHLGTIRDYEQFMYRLFCIRSFEEKGIFVMNPVMNWLAAADKFGALLRIAAKGMPVPDTVVTEHMFVAYSAAKKFGTAVVKPLRSAMGFGVFRVDDPDFGMHVFSYLTNMSKPIYVQRYMEKEGGGDYRVIVIGGEAIGAEFRKGITWKSNVAQGAVPKAVKLNAELSELAVKACEVLGLEYGGVDIAEGRDGYSILETNPTLSWQGFKKATGINPARQIVRHLIKKARG